MPKAPRETTEKKYGGNAKAGPSKPKPLELRDESGIPGLSKLKSQIRQTKRLLAKDNLEPGLRLSTQRRLTSLEADLAAAERRNVEKKNGGKYHMVKFFERQKLMRLIKKYKKTLSDESLKSKKRERTERDLQHARVMLNYVLHYPNEQKYISLFPPSTSSSSSTTNPEDPTGDSSSSSAKLPPHLLTPSSSSSGSSPSDLKRLEILQKIEKMMESGSIPLQPEEEGRGKNTGSLGGETAAGELKRVKKEVQKVAADAAEEDDDFFE